MEAPLGARGEGTVIVGGGVDEVTKINVETLRNTNTQKHSHGDVFSLTKRCSLAMFCHVVFFCDAPVLEVLGHPHLTHDTCAMSWRGYADLDNPVFYKVKWCVCVCVCPFTISLITSG